MCALYLVLLILMSSSHASPIRTRRYSDGDEKFGMLNALEYLGKFGYDIPQFDDVKANLLSRERVEKAIAAFQMMGGLDQTGVLDDDTMELMKTPRCGVKDRIQSLDKSSKYQLQGSRWDKRSLSYRISKNTISSNINYADMDLMVKKAFKLWEGYANIDFSDKEEDGSEVDIDIRFEKFNHGDDDPFDGLGGTLAHAFFPQFGGDLHMDDSEPWTIKSSLGINLLQTLTHEIGHSLGLEHSWNRSSVMAPFYQEYRPDFKLEQDDIEAIQALYGKKDNTSDDDDNTNTIDEEDKQNLSIKLQLFLSAGGFNPGKINGSWGKTTTKALQRFLNSQGGTLKVDGDFGRFTVKTLQWYLNSYWRAGLTTHGRFQSTTKKALLEFLSLSNVKQRVFKLPQK